MNNIFLPLKTISGIGDSLAKFLSKLIGGNRVVDLLYHQPSGYISKNYLPELNKIKEKELIITKVKVEAYFKPENPRQPFKIRCFNNGGYLTLIFFKTFPNYIEKYFTINSEIAISGIAERFNNELQISHPEYVFPALEINKIPKVEVIYPLINGLNQKLVRNKIAIFLKNLSLKKINSKENEFPEWINNNLLKQKNWPSWKQAITELHQPSKVENIYDIENFNRNNLNRKRLAFDELLASQIANQIVKNHLKNKNCTALIKNISLREKLINALPFKLTTGQEKVLAEIDNDLTSNKKMLRLLQGDVGSGKTIIALLAMLLAVENDKQATIICPISLLAIQHYKTFQILTKDLGVNIALLTSKTTKKNKEKILQDLKNAKIDILIGTHSIIEPNVAFKNLSVIVIDEQHRFGVMQRMKLAEKGDEANILLMSATPIPRSLMLTFYGNIDISTLKEKPQNRKMIDTRAISMAKEQEVLTAISRALSKGDKIYWICPLIENKTKEELELESDYKKTQSQKLLPELSNVNERFEKLVAEFGEEKVALINGKMKEKAKDQVMKEFELGQKQILVATTVIEVGIDIADATVIVIENCENFGLSQLHQLRGRVGRNDKDSYCILLYGKRIGENGRKRLEVMKNSNDGFFIAEEDLKLRGSGDMLGLKQSGLPEYKIASLDYDLDLLDLANRHSNFTLSNNQNQESKKSLENLLTIFNYHQCLKLIFGG